MGTSNTNRIAEEESNTIAIYAVFPNGEIRFMAEVEDRLVEVMLASLTRRPDLTSVTRFEIREGSLRR
jgi:hypothetical protein